MDFNIDMKASLPGQPQGVIKEPITLIASGSNDIDFGIPVKRGANNKECTLIAAGTDEVVAITLRTENENGIYSVSDADSIPGLQRGGVSVPVADNASAIKAGVSAHYFYAGTNKGKWTDTSVVDETINNVAVFDDVIDSSGNCTVKAHFVN